MLHFVQIAHKLLASPDERFGDIYQILRSSHDLTEGGHGANLIVDPDVRHVIAGLLVRIELEKVMDAQEEGGFGLSEGTTSRLRFVGQGEEERARR